ncbi:MAG: hypothetical protein RPS47_10295 [Colwellia sp.]
MKTANGIELRKAPKIKTGDIYYTLQQIEGEFVFNIYNEGDTGTNSSADICLGDISKLFSGKSVNKVNPIGSEFFSSLLGVNLNNKAFVAAVLRGVGLIEKHDSGRFLNTLAVEVCDFEDHIAKFIVEPFEKIGEDSELRELLGLN